MIVPSEPSGLLRVMERLPAQGEDGLKSVLIGRALSHAEQNAIEYEWLIHRMEERGLDTGLVAVPKIKAGRG